MSSQTATQQQYEPTHERATTTRRTRVRRVVAVNGSQAWAYLEGVGWRRLSALAGEDLMAACCRARLSRRQVEVEVSSTHLLRVGE